MILKFILCASILFLGCPQLLNQIYKTNSLRSQIQVTSPLRQECIAVLNIIQHQCHCCFLALPHSVHLKIVSGTNHKQKWPQNTNINNCTSKLDIVLAATKAKTWVLCHEKWSSGIENAMLRSKIRKSLICSVIVAWCPVVESISRETKAQNETNVRCKKLSKECEAIALLSECYIGLNQFPFALVNLIDYFWSEVSDTFQK